jgi:hypothetical protein
MSLEFFSVTPSKYRRQYLTIVTTDSLSVLLSSLFSNDICQCYVICVIDSFVNYILILSHVTLTTRFLQSPSLFIIFVYVTVGVPIAVHVLRSVHYDELRNNTIILFNFANCSFAIELNYSSLFLEFLSLFTTRVFYAIRDLKFSKLRCFGLCSDWHTF